MTEARSRQWEHNEKGNSEGGGLTQRPKGQCPLPAAIWNHLPKNKDSKGHIMARYFFTSVELEDAVVVFVLNFRVIFLLP